MAVAAFTTAGSLITRARALLQDTIEPYRVPDTDLLAALNEACMEAKRLRPDLFLRTFGQSSIPVFTATTDTIVDLIPEEFHPAFIYYITGNAQLRDEEENQDQRATIFLNKFVAQLTTLPS
jgi:UDP-N-acetylglucosamine:LPS N-acetylglucosamine transferase